MFSNLHSPNSNAPCTSNTKPAVAINNSNTIYTLAELTLFFTIQKKIVITIVKNSAT